jgi:hypothetical protein
MANVLSHAPWTDAEVESLNAYQQSGVFHEFTCGGDECRATLVASRDGWACPECGYEQGWAHPFMADGRWREFAKPWPTEPPQAPKGGE